MLARPDINILVNRAQCDFSDFAGMSDDKRCAAFSA